MARIVIFGTGKVADVIYHHIRHAGTHDVVAFTVDAQYAAAGSTFHEKPIVPFDQLPSHFPPSQCQLLVAIGYHDLNAVRAKIYALAKSAGYTLASFISPRASVGDWLEAGDNCIVLDNAMIEPGVRLGNNVVVWSGVLVGHHSTIDDHAWIAGQAVFGGSAHLGERSFVGLGAIVGHEVDLGAQSLVSAGALVMKCADDKAVFVEANTPPFRLDSEKFLKITKLR